MIDPTLPVHLKRMAVCPRTGNVYIARSAAYQPGELPERFLTDEFCTQSEPVQLDPVARTVDLRMTSLERPNQESHSLNPRVVPSLTIAEPVQPMVLQALSELIKPEGAELVQPEPSNEHTTLPSLDLGAIAQLQINVAENLSEGLQGLSEKMIARIMTERSKKVFSDFADLKRRVPLGSGISWDDYADRITF